MSSNACRIPPGHNLLLSLVSVLGLYDREQDDRLLPALALSRSGTLFIRSRLFLRLLRFLFIELLTEIFNARVFVL